jgi:hypothetical protein
MRHLFDLGLIELAVGKWAEMPTPVMADDARVLLEDPTSWLLPSQTESVVSFGATPLGERLFLRNDGSA